MTSVTSWLIGILSVVLLGTVADLLLSETRTGKYVKSIFAAVTVLVIIMPIPGLIRNGFDFDGEFMIKNEFDLDENYLAFSNRVKLAHLERGIVEQLNKDGVKNAAVTVEGEILAADIKIQLVRVNLQNAVIDGIKPHINKYELVRDKISGYLNIEKGRIIVDG